MIAYTRVIILQRIKYPILNLIFILFFFQCGSILFAQLEIWKVNSMEDTHLDVNNLLCENNGQSSSSSIDLSDGKFFLNIAYQIEVCIGKAENPILRLRKIRPYSDFSNTRFIFSVPPRADDDEEDEEMIDPSQNFSPSMNAEIKSTRGSGSHIHLWQFLKELLASPQTHGSCIRWLDRSKGVFKIEDSVRVARLWGKRKNRPAMNYDKLSRSIRQYYKKGIMKKTERSQRLVYQFCAPYNL